MWTTDGRPGSDIHQHGRWKVCLCVCVPCAAARARGSKTARPRARARVCDRTHAVVLHWQSRISSQDGRSNGGAWQSAPVSCNFEWAMRGGMSSCEASRSPCDERVRCACRVRAARTLRARVALAGPVARAWASDVSLMSLACEARAPTRARRHAKAARAGPPRAPLSPGAKTRIVAPGPTAASIIKKPPWHRKIQEAGRGRRPGGPRRRPRPSSARPKWAIASRSSTEATTYTTGRQSLP